MEAPWRWTSSVFLVLALSIGNTSSQNVGPNCLLPKQTSALQGELLCDNNQEIVNPRKINNVLFHPPNGLASGGPAAPVLESPRQAFRDRLCTQCPFNQQAQQACQCNERTDIVPISQSPFTNVSPFDAQSAYPGIPGPVFPFPQPTPQNQLPVGSPTFFPQQNVGLPQLEILPSQDNLLPFSKRALPSPSLCSQIESASCPNSVSYLNNHLTPFDSVARNELPVPGPVYNIPGPLFPLPQPTLQKQLSVGSPTCLPQQNVGLPELEIFPSQDPLLPFSKRLLPSPSLCSQIESASYPNSVSYLNNHLTPFDPVAQNELPVLGALYNNPGPLMPFPQSTPQNQLLIGPPTCLPQQNVGLPQLEFLNPEESLLPFSKRSLPSPSLCSQIESASYPNGGSCLNNNFTPLNPIAQQELPVLCKDVKPRGDALPLYSTLTQSSPPMCPSFTQTIPVNNQGPSVDVYSPGLTQCPSSFNGSPTNSFLSHPSKMPIQGPTPPCTQNLPQSEVLGLQCDILPETPACLTGLHTPIGASLQSSLPLTPFNMFNLPRPTIFQPSYLPCDLNTNRADQVSVYPNPTLIQQNSICPQVPTAPAAFMPNIWQELPFQNGELLPLHSHISQPILNSGCSFVPDVASINSLPPTVIPPAWGIPSNGFGGVLPQLTNSVDSSITPLNLFPTCIPSSQPILPTSINRPCNNDVSGFCGSSVPDTIPVPINFQINVPPPIIPPPTITIINTTPLPDDTVSTNSEGLIDYPNSMPPMIIEGRRSRSRSWLPLILVSLFARDCDFRGYGGGCSCDSGPIPIPYPIPIPTNNPVIVN